MAALYEATKEGTTTGENPLFHSIGAGIEDLQDTFTFIDFLHQFNDLPEIDLEMADWILETQTTQPGYEDGRYQVRYEVLNKVTYIKTPGESKYRLLPSQNEPPRPHLVQGYDSA